MEILPRVTVCREPWNLFFFLMESSRSSDMEKDETIFGMRESFLI